MKEILIKKTAWYVPHGFTIQLQLAPTAESTLEDTHGKERKGQLFC